MEFTVPNKFTAECNIFSYEVRKGFFKKKNVLTAVVSVLFFFAIGTLRNGTYGNELRGALTYRR